MRKFIVSMFLIFSLLLIGCPISKEGLKKFAKGSARVSAQGTVLTKAIETAFNEGRISAETKENFKQKLKPFAVGVGKFNDELKVLATKYAGRENEVTPQEISAMDVLFSSEVIRPFLEILTMLNVLSPERAEQILIAIQLLRTIIYSLSNSFGKDSVSFNEGLKLKDNAWGELTYAE